MRLISFGHLGDGNIHLGIGPVQDKHAVEALVYRRLGEVAGSISAEHGIGLEKREFLRHSRSEAEIAMMRSIKRALDPKSTLNPGKVIWAAGDRLPGNLPESLGSLSAASRPLTRASNSTAPGSTGPARIV